MRARIEIYPAGHPGCPGGTGGLKGVIELAVLCGFYQAIAAVIFAFEVPLPEGVHESFDPGGG